MRILYLDLGMGAAGDMLSAALYELLDDDGKREFLNIVNDLGVEGVSVTAEKAEKCGIGGTHMDVRIYGVSEGEHDHGHEHEHDHDHAHAHEHSHHHNDMQSILHTIEHLKCSTAVKDNVRKVYEAIADAESTVHKQPVSSIHFHEVGEKDALVDIASVCILMEMLAVDKVVSGPVCTGFGKVKCAHGILPVPAPATALLLRGVSAYSGNIEGELCTPTGAALVKHFVSEFGGMPVMTIEKCGYGMGKKDFAQANCVRAMLGSSGLHDDVAELSCNVDDMTAEAVAYATGLFMQEGALDVYTTNIGMKKGRQGIMINVLCAPADVDRFVKLIFRHTTTIGIRRNMFERYVLDRRTDNIDTGYGSVRVKVSEGYGVKRSKTEYDDICRVADENDISLTEAAELIDGEIKHR